MMRASVLLAAVLLPTVVAGLALPSIYGSNMVFQHSAPVQLWGTDDPGSKVSVTLLGKTTDTMADAKGEWAVTLPAQQPSQEATSIQIASSASGSITLQNVAFGEVYICSGQSNMGLTVMGTFNSQTEIHNAGRFGNRLRVMSVATEASYADITTPQRNLTTSIPWSVSGPSSVPGMSAVCYYFGTELATAQPTMFIGMISSAWGGTPIEVWMSPEALKTCRAASPSSEDRPGFVNPDPGLLGGLRGPNRDSCLYYSMIYPLLPLNVKGFLWYQGEANSGNPVRYSYCFPTMIKQWRSDWTNSTSGATTNAYFLFVQLSSWPDGDAGHITDTRFAQESALKLENVGMAVAADIGDPSGCLHPIHPPWKQEVSRRLFLTADNMIYGNVSSTRQGPVVQKIVVDHWDSSWGDFHYGYGSINACKQFGCAGIRVTFDQPVVIRQEFGRYYGFGASFELLAPNGNVQPATLFGVRSDDSHTVQLNTTFIYGKPSMLRYGWHDYPNMPLFNVQGRPVPPFNATVPW
eukprot:m.18772 g.18772  ORF g.18772 m.18772 type:complete len:521 (-) comp3696_c0_seq2:70-1632(-)